VHEACASRVCDSVTYYCTNAGSTWAWRTSPSCTDGNDCTYAETCNGSGQCTGGTTVTCPANTTCASYSCNGTASCDMTPINISGSCDDGQPCSYGETCNASGFCTGGTPISCQSTTCVTRSCNGTSTCSESYPSSIPCDDGDFCTSGETCNGSGGCTGGTPNHSCGDGTCQTACGEDSDNCPADCEAVCTMPSVACTGDGANMQGCANARIIGRSQLDDRDGYYTYSRNDTTDGSNDFEGSCHTAGKDHAYRIWLNQGEELEVRLMPDDDGYDDPSMHVYRSAAGCEAQTCDIQMHCDEVDNYNWDEYIFTAPQMGWYTTVMDDEYSGRTTYYGLRYYLRNATLGCP